MKLIINRFVFGVLTIILTLSAGETYAQMYSVRDTVIGNSQKGKIFTQPTKKKAKKQSPISYVFVENYGEMFLGCTLYKIENGKQTPMEDFSIAAYTKDANGRMNYNSILPYISICQAGERVILSFECPLIILYPDRINEKILQTKNLYGKITDKSIELINY